MSSLQKAFGVSIIIITLFLFTLSIKGIGSLISSPATVFLPLASSSVQTTLEWYSSDYPTKTNWNTADSYCSSLPTNSGMYPNISWRLPTIQELENAKNSPSTTTSPNLKNWFYWSSSETSVSSSTVYDLDMTSGINSSPSLFEKRLPDDYARCVRNVVIAVPNAPTDIYAQAGNAQATVSFTPPISDGYSNITYNVTSHPDNITATSTIYPIVITGLTNGTAYTFTVTATNMAGTSEISTSSNEVVPDVNVNNPTRLGTFYIDSWADLSRVGSMAGIGYKEFILRADLSSATAGYSGIGNNWTPIGGVFSANFDGGNHTISDLIINKPTTDYVGLFSFLKGNISNLGLVNVNITGQNRVGGITAYTSGGLITNSYVTGTVSGGANTGGLVGVLNCGTVENSYSNVSVTSSGISAGALIGNIGGDLCVGTVKNSYSKGIVSGSSYAGGLVGGIVMGEVIDSFSTATTSATSYVGGLVGGISTFFGPITITNSFSNGSVSGSSNVGGLVGNGGITSNTSFWDTQTSGQPTSPIGVGKSTNLMRNIDTYSSIWSISTTTSDYNNGYPYLGWQASNNSFTWLIYPTAPILPFAVGDGTIGNPYQVSSWTELNNVRDYLSAYFILTTDLSSVTPGYSGVGSNWTPIGGTFSGNFNGNNHTISDLVINKPTTDYVGLFSIVSGPIYNLGLINETVTGRNYVGGLAGKQTVGNITSCYASNVAVNGIGNYSGGLVGQQLPTFPSNPAILTSYSSGSINSSGNYLGGLVGYSNTVRNSYSSATINGSATTSTYVGGIIGYASGADGSIRYDYATGNVTGYSNVGGLVGYLNTCYFADSYATGNVIGDSNVGGLIGYFYFTYCVDANNSYSIGSVSGNSNVGGLVGGAFAAPPANNMLRSFWDIQTSGTSTSIYGTGTTTTAMKTTTTYTGWNNTTVWNIINGSYPTLR